MKNVDVIILGQGFAGTSLAFALRQMGAVVHIFDPAPSVSASRIAAGLINPVLGKRFTIDDDYPMLFAEAKEFYQHYEQVLGERFFHELPIMRVIANEEEAQHLAKRKGDARYSAFIAENEPTLSASIYAPLGARLIQGGAWLDAETYLHFARALFASQLCMTTATIADHEIEHFPDHIRVREYNAQWLVDARGWESSLSAWWQYLVFQPAKGEILEIATADMSHDNAVVGGVYCIPRGGGKREERRHIVGSTYTWDNLNMIPTEHGRQELQERFRALTSTGYTITAHRAAVRPATDDRNPYIGVHPRHERLMLFNGFGSRGSLTTPWYAKQCAQRLLLGYDLPKECDIARFRSAYAGQE
jgi:glycine oxidase